MDKRTEARLVANSRAWERRKQAQEGRYAVNPLAQHFVRTRSGGIPAAGDSDAVRVVEGVEIPIYDGDKQAKSRHPGSAQCILLRFNESRTTLVPCVNEDPEGESELVLITVYNWSANPIAGETVALTEVRAGRHFLINGECKKEDEEEDEETIYDGGEWT